MPLIQSKSQAAAAEIAHHLAGLQGDYESAARKLNAMTQCYIGLPNDDLAAFANNLGPQDMGALTAAHGEQGAALNALIAGLNAVLESIGRNPSTASVDIRPLSEKLAAQYREVVFDGATFSVNDLPRPEPETPPDPQ